MTGLLVVTVCTGNTCRSPMAEVLLARSFADHGVAGRVESVGTLGWNERGATPHAIDAMAARGLDLSDHRSRALTAADDTIAAADLVLAMTRIHAGAAVARHAHLRDRVFLPGEFIRLAGGQPRERHPVGGYIAQLAAGRDLDRPIGRASDEIADPAGEDRATYAKTAAQLERLMHQIAGHLA